MDILLQLLVWCVTGALILSGSLRLGAASLYKVHEHPRLLLRFLLVVWVAVPLLAILVTRLFDLRGIGGAVLLLMAICPGVPLLLASARKVSASVNTALVVLLATAVTAPVLIPLWSAIMGAVHPVELDIPARHVISFLLPTIYGPLALGFAIRAISPRFATSLADVADKVFELGILVVLIVELIEGASLLLDVHLRTILAAALITYCEAWLGYWAGKPTQEDQRSTSLAAAMGNPALAFAVVTAGYPGYKAGAVLAAYALLRAVLLIPLKRWLKPI